MLYLPSQQVFSFFSQLNSKRLVEGKRATYIILHFIIYYKMVPDTLKAEKGAKANSKHIFCQLNSQTEEINPDGLSGT